MLMLMSTTLYMPPLPANEKHKLWMLSLRVEALANLEESIVAGVL
jgi:hypothetical protein